MYRFGVKRGEVAEGRGVELLAVWPFLPQTCCTPWCPSCLRGDQTDAPAGLWTKCDRFFADYFLKNWTARRQPQGFLLYDPPPRLSAGAPIFIHSDKDLRLLARFRDSQYVAGHKFTCDEAERLEERERIWTTWRAGTVEPESRADFDRFWGKQHGVRGLIVIDEVAAVPQPPRFKTYGRALEWGYPWWRSMTVIWYLMSGHGNTAKPLDFPRRSRLKAGTRHFHGAGSCEDGFFRPSAALNVRMSSRPSVYHPIRMSC